MELFAVYSSERGYYNFVKDTFDGMHEYNFDVRKYATSDKERCNKLAAQYHATVITI